MARTPMAALLRLTFRLLRLQAGPQDVPYSTELMGAVIAVYAAVGVAYGAVLQPLSVAIGQVIVAVVVSVLFVRLLLNLRQKTARMVQTLTAIFAVDALLTALYVPLLLMAAPELQALPPKPDPAQISGIVQTALLGNLVVIAWSVVVVGHIFRHALEVSRPVSLGLSVTQTLLLSVLMTAGANSAVG